MTSRREIGNLTLKHAIRGALLAAALSAQHAQSAELPVVCVAGNCGAGGPSTWVTSGAATATATDSTLTVNQGTDRAVLNWASFNVGADGRVVFRQPRSSSIALNRIYQDSPSRIFGRVEANGEIYLVNPNGVIFGRTAVINASGILASTLDIAPETFEAGIASSSVLKRPDPSALSVDANHAAGYVVDANGAPIRGTIDADGRIVADPNGEPILVRLSVQQGAQLSTNGANGRVLLASQNVDNAGRIAAADGQVILAAGTKVYLQTNADPALRGLLVEVDGTGQVLNRQSGEITTPRGNTTLVGLAVNQQGRISATTTVAANGSIRLLARNSAVVDDLDTPKPTLRATQTGTLELGGSSVTSVLPELDDTTTATNEQQQNPSRIEMMGHQVSIRSGARIRAPGGELIVAARRDPTATPPGTTVGPIDPDSQLRIESGATIDLAGSDATLPMSRNLVTVELRASELADSPNQRNSAIRTRAVTVDARVGTPLADVSGALGAVPRTIAERTAVGGTATFSSDGDIVAATGSLFDVSGGTTHYESGMVQTSQLIGANGRLYDIGSADPARTYVGILDSSYRRVDDRWGQIDLYDAPNIGRFEPGYDAGNSAGTLQFAAPTLVLNGNFVGHTTIGPYQRDPARTPSGGTLRVGLSQPLGAGPEFDYRAPSIELVLQRPNVAVGDGAGIPSGLTLQLPLDYLANGFTRTELYSNASVTLPQGTNVTLPRGSTFIAQGQSVSILSDITSIGGSIALTSHDTTTPGREGIRIGDHVTLDVSGSWSNDAILSPNVRPTDPLLYNGGSISLTAASAFGLAQTFALGDGVTLRADGGAQVRRDGSLVAGRGGAIALATGGYQSSVAIGENVNIRAFGVLGALGGTFSLEAARIDVANGTRWAEAQTPESDDAEAPFTVGSALFSEYGFSTVTLTASGLRTEARTDVLSVRPDTQITAVVRALEIDPDAPLNRDGGGTIGAFSAIALPDPQRRAASNVAFTTALTPSAPAATSTSAGDLRVSRGAVLQADPRSRFAFSSLSSIFIDGTVQTHGGTIEAGTRTPSSQQEGGYLEGQRVQIGATAVLDVSGTTVYRPNDRGLLTGDAIAGGSIRLASLRGSIVAEAGSVLDISGTGAALDLSTGDVSSPIERHTVATAAGSLLVRAPESIGLFGTLDAAAGVGDTGAAAGGSLTLQLSRNLGFSFGGVADTFPTAPRRTDIDLHDVPANGPLPSGSARISQDYLIRSGIDALAVQADDQISLASGLDLSLARSLSLDAPAFRIEGGGDVSLAASYVALGSSLINDATAPATYGTSTLAVDADFIELTGSASLDSIGALTLRSRGDIRVRGTVREDDRIRGNLNLAGDLTLDAARVYGATASEFTFNVAGGPRDRVRIVQHGTSPATPLSVAASLTINARDIEQGGTLLAPFGSITLNGSDSVALTSGSVTSVSATGTVLPYGSVSVGDWMYLPTGNVSRARAIEQIPTRQVSINGRETSIASRATVDVRGGGDLTAYEWVPGTGGTRDALSPTITPGLYAILPSLAGQFAPYDPQEFAASTLTPGDSIYLSGYGDLAAGVYPLLPARYALLPGAMLVQAVPNTAGLLPGTVNTLSDGTPVVAGYRTFSDTALGSAQYAGFALRSGSYGRVLAAYDDFSASSFFAARAARLELPRVPLPADAGSLALAATTRLDARGSVLTDAASGGLRASIDIAAPRLIVTGATASDDQDAVQVSAAQLVSWNPGRLTLGGTRSGIDATQVDVVADDVIVAPGVDLRLGEIVIAAHDRIELAGNARIASTSANTNPTAAPPALNDAPLVLTLTGDDTAAAVLAVSDTNELHTDRDGASDRRGSITLGSAASIASRGAITVDAPAGGELAGRLDATDARVSLGAEHLVFGTNPVADALGIDSSLEAQLNVARGVRLTATTLDLLRDVTLDLSRRPDGAITLRAQTLHAAPDVDARFAASHLTLQGSDAAAAAMPAAGNARLSLSADTLTLGSGTVTVDGLATSTLTARREVVGEGEGTLRIAGNLDVETPLITVASDADTAIELTAGAAQLSSPEGVNPSPSLELGGSFSLTADSIDSALRIAAPSGLVTLQSRGALTLGATSAIDVAGRTVIAAGREAGSQGGTVRLQSGTTLFAASGATLDASGAGDSAAGNVSIDVGGEARLDGTMNAHAGTGASGGRFALRADTLASFDDLVVALQAGGFSGAQHVRVQHGDLELGADRRMDAQSIELVADAGSVRITGDVNALEAVQRGALRIFGGSGVTLDGGGSLSADAAPGGRRGGDIEIGTTTGTINLASGSRVSADGAAYDGTLMLNAPVVGNDVAIEAIGADVSQLREVALAPRFAYDAETPFLTQSDLDGAVAAASAFVDANGTAILSRVAAPTATSTVIRPQFDVTRDGDLDVGAFDLSTWRFAGEAGSLSVHATGSIVVSGSITDGFAVTGAGTTARYELLPGASSSISLLAGADLSLGSSAVIRTGTGAVSIAAMRDIGFGTGASVFTGGVTSTDAPSQILQVAAGRASLVTFPDLGGSISLHAGHDILGTPIAQSVSTWALNGTRTSSTTPFARLYAVNPAQFGWNVGTLGGGDLSITAGHDVSNLSAAAAATTRVADNGSIVNHGGGSMSLYAGNDASSNVLYQARSSLTLRADGALGSVRTNENGAPIYTLLALGDVVASVDARRDLALERVLDPGILPTQGVAAVRQAYAWTYGEGSALRLQSAAGNIGVLEGSDQSLNAYFEPSVLAGSALNAFSIYPASLTARAFTHDIDLNGEVTLFPSSRGQLDLFAVTDIVSGERGRVAMSDGAVRGIPTVSTAATSQSAALTEIVKYAAASRHVADEVPAFVTAGNDILGGTFLLAKAAHYSAGHDIVDPTIFGQNLRASDITRIDAGRDLRYPRTLNRREISIGGPGRLDVLAGRDVDLGFSNGISTTGRLLNPSIASEDGADVTVVAGLGRAPDYNGFIDTIVAPSARNLALLVEAIERGTGQRLTPTDALALLRGLGSEQQRPFVMAVFFGELIQAGRDANAVPDSHFEAGYAAINALFPGSAAGETPTDSATDSGQPPTTPYRGDINLAFSRIYTLAGGNISLLIPGGLLNVGLASPPPTIASRPPSELGIVAQRAGGVYIFADADVLVNKSRVFTLLGGDIAIWSTRGNIDAGRGAKSSLSAPPPFVNFSDDGRITLDFSGAVAGSGIRTIITGDGVAAGDVDLIAPVGFVDAGDAGIGSAGNLNVAARQIIGANNIDVGGTSTGVPAQTSGLGAALSGASAAGSSATNASSDAVEGNDKRDDSAAPLAQTALAWLDVFVVGLGEAQCKQDDIECLKKEQAK
jgi:filamentous hemagglutinin